MDYPPCSPPTAPAPAPAPAPTNRTKAKPKPSIFSRLRSKPHNPYSHPSGASSTPVIPLHRANGTNAITNTNTNNNNGAGSVRGMQVSAPIMLGMNRSEEIFGAANTTSNGMGLEDEIEWERVRTLPRVRLVPPEDEGEPIILYPPPHFLRPATPPPRLPHPFLSPPSSPPRRSTASASPPPPTSPPRRPSSIYSSNPSWAGMADGFVLPPPKFSRPPASASGAYNARNGAAGVVMPKTRRELVQDREKRMSAVWIANEVGMDISSPPPKPVVLDQMDEYERPSQSEDTTMIKPLDQVSGEIVEPTLPALPISPPVPLPSAEGEAPEQIVAPIEATTDVNSQAKPSQANTPKPSTSSSESARKSRALSLSAALSSSTTTATNDSASSEPPLPSVPSVIRKQKSLKKFFSSTPTSTTENDAPSVPSVPPPAPAPAPAPISRSSLEEPKPREGKPRSGGGILSRAKSKPSLRIDVKATKSSGPSVRSVPVTPALSTGVSDTTTSLSSALSNPQTPKSAPISQTTTPTARLSKRFSLSNMSHAFKKAIGTPSTSMPSNSGSQVPKVPDLPEVYKKERDIRGTGRVLESAVPLSPRTRTTPLAQAQENDQSILTPTGLPRRSESLKALQRLAQGEVDDSSTYDTPSALGLTLRPASPPILPPLGPAFDHQASNTNTSRPLSVVSSHTICEVGSTTIDSIDPSELDIEENEQELVHAQLMKVSPRTLRDPSISLQQYIANVKLPGIQNNVVIVPVPRGMRRSVEAVVLGSLTTPPGMAGGNERSVLDRLNELEEDEDKRISISELERRGSGDTIEEEEAVTTPLDGPAFFLPPVIPPTGISRSNEEEVSRMDENKEDDLDSLPSDTVLVETPPAQTSTIFGTTAPVPGKGLTSPEKILRKLSRNKAQQQTPYHSTILNERAIIPVPLPPLPFDRDGDKENVDARGGKKPHSALLAAVQLRSLHFDKLDLDFGKWSKTPVSAATEGVDW